MYVTFEKMQEARIHLLAAASKVNARLYVTVAPESKSSNNGVMIVIAIAVLYFMLRR